MFLIPFSDSFVAQHRNPVVAMIRGIQNKKQNKMNSRYSPGAWRERLQEKKGTAAPGGTTQGMRTQCRKAQGRREKRKKGATRVQKQQKRRDNTAIVDPTVRAMICGNGVQNVDCLPLDEYST